MVRALSGLATVVGFAVEDDTIVSGGMDITKTV